MSDVEFETEVNKYLRTSCVGWDLVLAVLSAAGVVSGFMCFVY